MNPMPENQPTEPLEPMNNNPSGKSRLNTEDVLTNKWNDHKDIIDLKGMRREEALEAVAEQDSQFSADAFISSSP